MKKRKTHPKPGHGALKVSGIQVPKMAARAMDGFCDALVGVPFQQRKKRKLTIYHRSGTSCREYLKQTNVRIIRRLSIAGKEHNICR